MLEDLKESTQQDKAAQQLITAIKSNFSKGDKCPSPQPFKKLKNQLTFENGLILLNSHRIVVPIQKRNIDKAFRCLTLRHRKNKKRARQIVYWAGINSDIKIPLKSARNIKAPAKLTTRTITTQFPPIKIF